MLRLRRLSRSGLRPAVWELEILSVHSIQCKITRVEGNNVSWEVKRRLSRLPRSKLIITRIVTHRNIFHHFLSSLSHRLLLLHLLLLHCFFVTFIRSVYALTRKLRHRYFDHQPCSCLSNFRYMRFSRFSLLAMSLHELSGKFCPNPKNTNSCVSETRTPSL